MHVCMYLIMYLVEIEENLIEAQESNVNIQVRLENAVIRQKESDIFATRTIRHMHTNLATVGTAL